MENQNSMDLLLNKIKEQMALQTIEITAAVTESVSKSVDEKLAALLEENKSLKQEVATMKQKLNYLEDEKKKTNLIFFGVSEAEKNNQLIDYITKFIEKETKIPIQPYEINKAYRLGSKGINPRPILVSFTTTWKRNQILKNKKNCSSGIHIKEDFSKETLERRRELIPKMLQERQKGKIAYIKKDKLIVKGKKEDNIVKRKIDQVESPHKSPNQVPPSAPKKLNKLSLDNFVTRSRSSSLSEAKN